MHIGRFKSEEKIFYGEVKANQVREIAGDIFSKYHYTDNQYDLADLKILTPSPSCKIILTGLNYQDHARELNFDIPDEPVIFIKPSTTLIAHNENIIYPDNSKQVDYEAELAFIIKDECHKIRKEDAYKYILGYTCLNDVTARDIQKKDGQWTRAKSFNTFCPVGPFIYIPESGFDPHKLQIRTFLNEEIRQDSNTSNLIFSIDYLLWFVCSIMTLYPGDIISTGTPSGIGSMNIGDEVRIEVEKVGSLKNKIV